MRFLTVVAFALLALRAVAEPAIVQSTELTAANTQVLVEGVTPGNALVVQLINPAADSRTWTVSDDVEGAWENVHTSLHIDEGAGLMSAYFLDHTGGDVTVTIGTVVGSVPGSYFVHEVTGVDEPDLSFSSWDSEDQGVTTSKFPSPLPVSANSITFLSVGHNASAGNSTFVEAGWTEILDETDRRLWAYNVQESAGSLDAEHEHGNRDSAMLMFGLRAAAADETAPEVESATINEDGDTLTVVFDESVTVGTDGWIGFSLGGVSGETLTYSSGDNTDTVVFSISDVLVLQSDSVTLDYTQPGDGVQDAAGNLLATFSDEPVTNNSTVQPPDVALVLDYQPLRDTDSGELIDIASAEILVLCGTAGARTLTLQDDDYEVVDGVVEIVNEAFGVGEINDVCWVGLIESTSRAGLFPATVVDRNQ